MDTIRQLLKTTPPYPMKPSNSKNPFRPGAPQTATTTLNPFAPNPPTTAATPVTILELFQSQGCDSCPPANNFLISHYSDSSTNTNTLLLTYEVTYWDRLGWPDTFGDTRWDARQRDYAARLGQRSVFTPQLLIDGGAAPVGGWSDVRGVLSRYQSSVPSSIQFDATAKAGMGGAGGWTVNVNGWHEGETQVLAVYFEEKPEDVRILRGENRGVTLPHRNVVRDLVFLGGLAGEGVFEVQERRGLKVVVLVQAGRGGKILGAVCLN